jgi:hypothetical protein
MISLLGKRITTNLAELSQSLFGLINFGVPFSWSEQRSSLLFDGPKEKEETVTIH